MATGIGAWTQMYVHAELEILRQYLETLDDSLVRKQKEADEEFERRKDELKAKWGKYADDIAGDEAFRLHVTFPSLAFRTTFVLTYALLEQELCKLCEQVQKHRNLALGYRDLRHHGIFAARTYLEKVCEVKYPAEALCKEIENLNKVRNSLLHANGYLGPPPLRNDTAKALAAYINTKTTLTIDSFFEVELSKAFCLESIETVRVFLKAVCEAVPDGQS
jgi:hypothetical protein